jgi:phenylpropionate dioxygenase-like ring-hydroxylating dioxygenase large terminal subunit
MYHLISLICVRDMPYPWLAAKENAYNDISHDQVLHHGVSAFANRAAAKPIPMKLNEMTPGGYTVRWGQRFRQT